MVREVTDRNFEKFTDTDELLVLDFWADWCVPCKTLGKVLEQVAKDNPLPVTFGKVDTDNNDELVQEFNIRNLPTLKFIKDGEVVDTMVGSVTREELETRIQKLAG